jgi:hypothetical protein
MAIAGGRLDPPEPDASASAGVASTDGDPAMSTTLWERWRPGVGPPRPLDVAADPARLALGLLGAGGAVAVGALTVRSPLHVVAVAVLGALTLLVWSRPTVAAYLIVGVTPLVVGIDRGTVIPVLRPNEALVAVLVGILCCRLAVNAMSGRVIELPRLLPVEWAFVAMAVASSVVPVAWLTAQGIQLTGDDVSYSLVMWKYLAVYAVVRLTVTDKSDVCRLIHIILATSSIVGIVAVLQVFNLFGVREPLARWYVTLGHEDALDLPRAGSTVSLPAAMADLMVLTACLAIGMWFLDRRRRPWYGAVIAVCVIAVFAAAEFSSVLGLIIATITVAATLRRKALVAYAAAGLGAVVVLMWPIIETRLQGFHTTSGFPDSWVGRWHNLQLYFWPELKSGSGWNFLMGVRPAARVPVPGQATGFVWIESGYLWLLWGGGLALLGSFVFFVVSAIQLTARAARELVDEVGVVALAVFTGVVVMTVLMTLDPHLTYRGSADCLFSLLAVCAAAAARRASTPPANAAPAGRLQRPITMAVE